MWSKPPIFLFIVRKTFAEDQEILMLETVVWIPSSEKLSVWENKSRLNLLTKNCNVLTMQVRYLQLSIFPSTHTHTRRWTRRFTNVVKCFQPSLTDILILFFNESSCFWVLFDYFLINALVYYFLFFLFIFINLSILFIFIICCQ